MGKSKYINEYSKSKICEIKSYPFNLDNYNSDCAFDKFELKFEDGHILKFSSSPDCCSFSYFFGILPDTCIGKKLISINEVEFDERTKVVIHKKSDDPRDAYIEGDMFHINITNKKFYRDNDCDTWHVFSLLFNDDSVIRIYMVNISNGYYDSIFNVDYI